MKRQEDAKDEEEVLAQYEIEGIISKNSRGKLHEKVSVDITITPIMRDVTESIL